MLKKAISGVLAVVSDLRPHELGPLRIVSAHVLGVRSVRLSDTALLDGLF